MPVYASIALHLEELIKSGSLKHGQKLPATPELAKTFSVTVATVQQALAKLMDKGLLNRAPRTGTFVNAAPMAKAIALVFGHNPMGHESAFGSLLLKNLDLIGQAEGINIACHFSIGGDSFDSQLRRLKEDIRSDRFACVVPIDSNPQLSRWLESQESLPWFWPPSLDHRQGAHDGLAYLLERGYGKIAFISRFLPPGKYPDPGIACERQGLAEALSERGAALPESSFLYWGASAKEGCERTLELLKDPESRPAALFVNHDILAKGALKAIAELGLEIPRDIALLTHANKGDEFDSPVPLTKIEVDPCEYAASAMRYAKARFILQEGAPPQLGGRAPDLVRSRLAIGRSCGEK